MAHFAELDNNNTVLKVIVVNNADIVDENGVEQEQIGIGFLKKLFGFNTNWKQTSYNHNFRFRYACIGMNYNESLNAFVEQKPFDSWILNPTTASWDAPIPEPTSSEQKEGYWVWNEINYQSDNTTGWVFVEREEPEYVDPEPSKDEDETTETEINEKYIWVDPPGRLELVE